jgi:hypothetical protein
MLGYHCKFCATVAQSLERLQAWPPPSLSLLHFLCLMVPFTSLCSFRTDRHRKYRFQEFFCYWVTCKGGYFLSMARVLLTMDRVLVAVETWLPAVI